MACLDVASKSTLYFSMAPSKEVYVSLSAVSTINIYQIQIILTPNVNTRYSITPILIVYIIIIKFL